MPSAPFTDEPPTPRLGRGMGAVMAVNVAMLFLQWTLVSDADVFTVLGVESGSLDHTMWSALTYMFVHGSVLQLAVNLYALALFGPRLEAEIGSRGFLLYYLWCGVGAVAAYLIFRRTGLLIGSTGAVIGVMYGVTVLRPRDEVLLFGVLPTRGWLAMALLTGALLAVGAEAAPRLAAADIDRMTMLSMLGGGAFAWLYLHAPAALNLGRLRHSVAPAPDLADDLPPRAVPRSLPRTRAPRRDEIDDVVSRSRAVASSQRPASRALVAPRRPSGELRAVELDRVLDKISRTGLESLTSAERAALDDIARRLRGEQ